MAFNKNEFAAGFLNQITDTMTKRREEAAAYKERQIEASERNQALITTRNSRANLAVSLGKEALQYLPEGVRSKGMIRTAMASGMTGVKELRDKLAKAHAQAGLSAGETLSINDVEAIINMPNIPSIDQSLMDMSLEDFAKKTYGAVGEATTVEDDTSAIGRLFGYGAKDRIKEELRDTPSMGGMSVADINAAARISEFNSLIPNAVMSFSEMKRFGKTDSFTFVRELTEIYQDAYDSSEADDAAQLAYNAYEEAQMALGRNTGSDPITAAEVDNQKTIARKAYAERKANRFIEGYASQYGGAGGGFFDQKFAMDQIAELMDKDYVDQLMKDYKYTPKADDKEKVTGEGNSTEKESVETDVGFDEGDVGEAEPIGDTDLRIAPSLPKDKHRPGGDRRAGFGDAEIRQWDRKYGDRYTFDGKPILVEPRPTDPKAKVSITKFVTGRKTKVNAMDNWDDQYGDTHNHDGTPKQLKGD
jgi:hypothetical protein